jgi:uncharacterized membrane protein YphA (DoxX/SURF4 family)
MTLALSIVQGFLTLVYLAAGAAKLAGAGQMKNDFERFGYSDDFRLVTGFIEVSAAALLAAGFAWPSAAAWGGALLTAVMAGALATHWNVGDSVGKMIPPLLLGSLAAWLALAHWTVV